MQICPSCHRHVRETTCPFCKTAIDPPKPAANANPARFGRGRVAVVAGALALGGCNGPVALYGIPVDVMAVDSADDHSVVAAYGIPLQDAAPTVDTGTGTDAGTPGPDGIAPAYGIPPQDAGPQQDVEPPHDAVVAAYGIVPLPDGGGH